MKIRALKNIALSCILTATLIISLKAPSQENDSLEVVEAASVFLKAFNQFDWPTFRSSFTKDATIFFPEWEIGKRVTGKTNIETTWLDLFPEFTDTANREHMNITPKDLHVQLMNRTAIVTFHLAGKDLLSRRTLVFVKQKRMWKIAHLHASFLEKE